MSEFSAIYYPYATVEDLDLLKKAIFAFNKLYLIYPTTIKDTYKGLMIAGDKQDNQHRFVDYGTRDLIASGFVEIIEPSKTVEKFNDLMIECYNEDMQDIDFLKIGTGKSWTLYKQKVPKTILDPEFTQKLSSINDPRFAGGFEARGDEVRMPLANAASIMISHAVFNSIEKNLAPITNDPLAKRFLDRRLMRGLKLLGSPSYAHYVHSIDRARLNYLMTVQEKIIDMVIPDADELIKNLSVEEILNFRAANMNLLSRYRKGMAEMVIYAQNSIEDPNFEQELSTLVKKNIQPAYDELREISGGLPPFALHTSHTYTPSSTAFGATSLTIIGGSPIASAILTSKETEMSHEAAINLISNYESKKPINLNYMLNVAKPSFPHP